MRASDVRVGQMEVVELAPQGHEDFGAALVKHAEVALYWTEAADEVLLTDGRLNWSVRGTDRHNEANLRELVAGAAPRLCHMAAVIPPRGASHQVVVEIRTFPSRYLQTEEMLFGVPETVVDDMIRKRLISDKAESPAGEAVRWLTQNTIVRSDEFRTDRLVVSTGRAPREAVEEPFRIYGNKISVDIRPGDNGGWTVVRLVRGVHIAQDDDRSLFMLEGQFGYKDASVAAQVRMTIPTILDSLVKQRSSYLSLWEDYNQLERDIIVKRARRLGSVRYSRRVPLPDGQWRFFVGRDQETSKVLARLEETPETDLEAARTLPDELQELAQDMNANMLADERTAAHSFAGQCTQVDEARGFVDLRPIDTDRLELPAESGVLYVALRGDRTRLARRQAAYRRLQQLAGPMPQLWLILEGRSHPAASRKRLKVRRNTVADLIGGNPTPSQMRALEAALNTPDIALIQGPPGTGKTRVIAALQALLADENKSGWNGGSILLTSYQHDAVDTAASRTLVMGLPAIRVGGRRDQGPTVDTVASWLKTHAKSLRDRIEGSTETPIIRVLRDVRNLAAGYIAHPGSDTEALTLLETVYQLAGLHVSFKLSDALLRLIQLLHANQVDNLPGDYEERQLLFAAASGLRTEPVSFGDDGPSAAYRLLRRLEGKPGLVGEADLALLQSAADCIDEPTRELLDALQQVQERLLDRLHGPSEVGRASLVNVDIEEVLTKTVTELHFAAARSYEGMDAVLYEYAADVENDPWGVRTALEAYSSVFAATCQQSVGFAMQRLKGVDDPDFDTVIIDEAARANPLDLFVPMVRARRRIVMVGDHRQLPQILEPDIERQLEVSKPETREVLSESLFQRLFKQLTASQKPGDIVRAVTLDSQYRMHPVLGDFVSRVFYEPYGEGFKSPRSINDFAHNIVPYVGKVAAWINKPISDERERGGQSKSRQVEAEWAADEARLILENQPHLSLGIITFYAAQEKEIRRSLVKRGLAEEDEGRFEILSRWGKGCDEQGRDFERLRVGTVDSFQGKEFDVVILSMTRSNDLPARDEMEARRKYGFLTLENRLCVAMSRQKRLLIVIGDAAMVTCEEAGTAVPGLRAFYDLCGGEYGTRV